MYRRRAIMRFGFARPFAWLVAVSVFLSTASLAQRGSINDPRPLEDVFVSYNTAPGTGVLIFKVFSERSDVHLDRQALLKLVNVSDQSVIWQATDDRSQTVFTNVPYGSYAVEVSAVGYLSSHKEFSVMNSLAPSSFEIVLKRDPNAINLDVISGVVSSKARKEAKHAVSLLKSGNLNSAQKHLDAAYKLAPENPELNFLLGYLYFQKKDFTQAGTYLGTATTLNPHHAQALTLLGRTGLEREDFPAARSALEQAVLADAENWLPHDLLADTYLHQKYYDKASTEAEIAITKGKSVASPARLILAEALVGLGRDKEAVQSLSTFLQESPKHPMAGQVRNLIAEISERDSGSPMSTDAAAPTYSHLSAIDPLSALPPPGLTMKPWQPPGIDEVKPALASNVTCPSATVIEESGHQVKELSEDVSRFAAVEDLFHQSLDPYGIPIRTETRKYDYVATIMEPQPGFVSVDEIRSDKLSIEGYPDQIASTGFVTLALVFHPKMRDDFEFSCEGLGDWRGQASWLVRFHQRSDRPNRMHAYNLGHEIHSVDLKGRAWITADKFQIVRIEAEMMRPMPEIQLMSEHQIVEYGPIPFPRKNISLWLPKSAEIYFDFRKHHYYRRHSFDHYMLFSVDAEEKRKEPVAKPANNAKQ